MSEMVERVARAIAKHRLGGAPEEEYWTDPVSGASFFRREARAAIEAMREPTPEMIVAADQHVKDQWAADTRNAYRAMIDVALK